MTEKSLRQKYKELSEAYARAIKDLNRLEDRIVRLKARTEEVYQQHVDMSKQCDALKAAAKEALFALERAGIEPELQERLQLAICNLPESNKGG